MEPQPSSKSAATRTTRALPPQSGNVMVARCLRTRPHRWNLRITSTPDRTPRPSATPNPHRGRELRRTSGNQDWMPCQRLEHRAHYDSDDNNCDSDDNTLFTAGQPGSQRIHFTANGGRCNKSRKKTFIDNVHRNIRRFLAATCNHLVHLYAAQPAPLLLRSSPTTNFQFCDTTGYRLQYFSSHFTSPYAIQFGSRSCAA